MPGFHSLTRETECGLCILFIVTSVFFVVVFRLLAMKFIVSAFNDLICSASLLLVSEIWLYL